MILIYTPNITPRIEYACEILCRSVWKTDFQLTQSEEDFKQSSVLHKIAYAPENPGISQTLFIPAADLLRSDVLKPVDIPFFKGENIQGFFPVEGGEIPFDVLASVFYMVTRYEEYFPLKTDEHGRFLPQESVLYQHKMLFYPVVNRWADFVKQKLSEISGKEISTSAEYRYSATYDIDRAFAYLCKSKWKKWGSFLKDVWKLNNFNIRKDPFDVFEYLYAQHQENNIQAIFFFLLGSGKPPDNNNNPSCEDFRKVMRRTAEQHETGLHASYASTENLQTLIREKQLLEEIRGKDIKKIRQHYIKTNMPGYFENVIKAGFTEDYSMGYPQIPGYRAGMSEPFRWFNLRTNSPTNLIIHPFSMMDSQHYYYQYPEWMKITEQMLQSAQSDKQCFISVWHNHLLNTAKQKDYFKNHLRISSLKNP